MKRMPDDERLSAYLDGELADAERTEIEVWLAEDPAARQTMDELRGVRASVESLPRATLGEDLSGRVLKLAERRMLTGVSPVEAGDAGGPPWPVPLKRFLSRRALTWSGLAVAIALLIMVTEHERPAEPLKAPPAAGQQQAQKRDVPGIGPGTLRPMPDAVAQRQAAPEGGIRAADQGSAAQVQQPAIFLIQCFVRAGDAPAGLDALLARHRIVRDQSQRLIDNAREQLGAQPQQSPPAGWTASGEASYVYAEARLDQIEALLQDLVSRPEQFPAVTSQPGRKAPAGQKQPVLLIIQPVAR